MPGHNQAPTFKRTSSSSFKLMPFNNKKKPTTTNTNSMKNNTRSSLLSPVSSMSSVSGNFKATAPRRRSQAFESKIGMCEEAVVKSERELQQVLL
ncbi:hypothetical protein HK102_011730, partial [Quaeritorhiza haematococci]